VKHLLSHLSRQSPNYVPQINSTAATEPDIASASSIATLDWSTWGPAATRWFVGCFDAVSVCGSRLLFTRMDPRYTKPVVLLFDFNQASVTGFLYQSSKKRQGSDSNIETITKTTGTSKSSGPKGAKTKGSMNAKGKRGKKGKSKPAEKVAPQSIAWVLMTALKTMGEHVVTEEWITKADYYLTEESDFEDEVEPLLMDVQSRLSFRVITKEFTEEFNKEAIRLGVHELICVRVFSPLLALLYPFD
jgi:hypothetical protein